MQTKSRILCYEAKRQGKIEAIVYDIVSKSFRINTEYYQNNCRPNAREIAEKFGCEIEFRFSEIPKNSYYKIIKRKTSLKHRFEIWKIWDLAKKGRTVRAKSLVLKGENYNQLMKAATEIHRFYGEGMFNNGLVYPMPETFVLGEHLRTNRFN